VTINTVPGPGKQYGVPGTPAAAAAAVRGTRCMCIDYPAVCCDSVMASWEREERGEEIFGWHSVGPHTVTTSGVRRNQPNPALFSLGYK